MTRAMLTRLVLVGALAVGAGTTAVAVPFLASAASTGYEAESATISQGTVATNHPGFTGTGFVDYSNVAGSYVEFSVPAAQAGTATLTFRYANGGTTHRPLRLDVNGANVSAALAFPATGSWDAWKTVSVTAALSAGTNTVRASATT